MIWTHLFPMHPFFYPLKTSENLKGALETNGLKTWMKIIMLNAEAYLLQPSRTSTMRFYPTFTRQLFLQKAPSQVFDSVLNTPLKRSHLQQKNAMNTSRRAWNVLRGVKPCCQLSLLLRFSDYNLQHFSNLLLIKVFILKELPISNTDKW